jgi:hypothetical protein
MMLDKLLMLDKLCSDICEELILGSEFVDEAFCIAFDTNSF